MNRQFGVLLRLLFLLCIKDPKTVAADEADALARQGFSIAKEYCYRCHGITDSTNTGFNVLDRASLLDREKSYVVPGKPDESLMWQRVEAGEMPPDGAEQLSDDQKNLLRRWIAAGAPTPAREKRPFRRDEDVIREIHRDLALLPAPKQPLTRYFTLAHLHNDNEKLSEYDLRLYRAALSKAINSLSHRPEIVVPRAVDEQRTIFAIDLSDYGLEHPDNWQAIVAAYPYGLRFSYSSDDRLAEASRAISQLSGTPLPFVRADWFIVTATRPPLYHQLARIPSNKKQLENELGVDVVTDFQSGKLVRAGFAKSGVSTANRVVNRHSFVFHDRNIERFGYYWESQDFAPNRADSNIFLRPLGPRFAGNEFDDFAFSHDGGELIVALPNGLQRYMLVDATGNRIDEGPIAVVRDLKQTSGSPVVVNGISCMHCHKNGMIPFDDTVREGAAVDQSAFDKVKQLYRPPEETKERVDRDSLQFLAALDLTIGPFLKVEEDAGKDIEDLPEPIGVVAAYYQRDVDLYTAANELGVEDISMLATAISSNADLQQVGLAPLANGAAIKRSQWEACDSLGRSAFHAAAAQLGRGTPYVLLLKKQ